MASSPGLVEAERLAEPPQALLDRAHRGRPLLAAWAALSNVLEWVFGTITLIIALAVLATIPFAQFLSLGYLLEVSGRVAQSGSLRQGFVGIRQAARLGRIAVGVGLLMVPVWLASSLADSARLIDPTSRATTIWTLATVLLGAFVLAQTASACLRGGRIRSFLVPRPVKTLRLMLAAGAYARARDAVWHFFVDLRLPYYFWLGLRGFVGAVAWLIVPVTLLAAASRLAHGGPLVGLVGGALMALVLLHLPFLQARFAAEDRLAAMFDIAGMRRLFARAPVAFLIALVATLALALPLYLLKIEIVPREAAWLPSLLFVVSIFPARLLTGWALARASDRRSSRPWFWRWPSRLAMLPVVLVYVVIVYFTQYLSWYGVWSLYEQHAFLVPAPFLGL
ncbi:MAG: DUF4013 domain-containing protein [Pirellulales bacterium]